ncbi:MAG: hypothetical protein BZY75_05530 [SAR202 cluster bacterium Io17-Chloro-G7]|nr:MAG: hypothetical protein BZY75_05530 [SAR202 cluster bacterium Io17-Chloro-G7]
MTQGEFDEFWDGLDRGLSNAPSDQSLDLSLEPDSFYSQPEWTVYQMRYNSADGHRLFSWLSVPLQTTGDKIPTLVRMPDYTSVHDVIYTPLRQHAVVMNPTHRGQRNSDQKFQASYPGLLTESIDQPESYVMRRVFSDALLAIDVLLGQSQFNLGPVTLTGSGLGGALALAAAARRSAVSAVAADTPLILGHPASTEGNPPYPLAEVVDYLRLYPDREQSVRASTAPLDPLKIAPQVNVPVLLSLGQRDRGQCPMAIGEELARLLPQCDLQVYDGASEGGGHEHGQVRGAWLRERLRIA